jgi:hypothetical protein
VLTTILPLAGGRGAASGDGGFDDLLGDGVQRRRERVDEPTMGDTDPRLVAQGGDARDQEGP